MRFALVMFGVDINSQPFEHITPLQTDSAEKLKLRKTQQEEYGNKPFQPARL